MCARTLFCIVVLLLGLGARAQKQASPCAIEGAQPGFFAVETDTADVTELAMAAQEESLREMASEPALGCDLVLEKVEVKVYRACANQDLSSYNIEFNVSVPCMGRETGEEAIISRDIGLEASKTPLGSGEL